MSGSPKTAAAAVAFSALARARRSCPRFLPNEPAIPTNVLTDILDCTIRSPSSFNLQPTQIILVRDATLKYQLAATCMLGAGNQHRTRDCTVLAVFLADLQASLRISRIQQLEQEQLLLQKMSTPANAATGTSLRHPNYLATLPVTASFLLGEGHAATLLKQVATDILSAAQQQPMPDIETASTWAYKNTALCVQTFLLAATAHNLATCTMEGYDGRRMRDVLRIPDRYGIPMVVATGTAYRESSHDNNNGDFDHKEPETNHPDGWRTPRLPLEEVVFTDTFGETLPWEKEDN